MAGVKARTVLLDVYSTFIQADKLSALRSSTVPLSAFVGEIAEATGKSKELYGQDASSKAETETWLSNIEADRVGDLKALDAQLSTRTYVAGPSSTAADIALVATLYPVVSTLPAAEQHAHPSVSRYVSHLSHSLPSSSSSSLPFAPWEPTYEGMPPIARKDLAQEKKEKTKAKAEAAKAAGGQAANQGKPQVAAAAGAAASAATASSSSSVSKEASEKPAQQPKKEKKEKPAKASGGGGGKGGAAAAAAEAATPLPSNIDLRVGKIVKIERHPDADSLYLETVDFGEPSGPRIVLSGLVNFVPMEKMEDRMVVGICNLKPVAMRGIKSHAMLLCATAKEGKDGGVEPIYPPKGSKPGDKIEVEGYEGQTPLEQLNPKKKIFEAIQPSYATTLAKEAAWVGPDATGAPETSKPRLLKTADGGICYAETFAEATLS